jgi:hypothetical protein
MSNYDAETLARLIGMLPPAPVGWVQAAQELPAAKAEIDQIVVRAQADAEFRAALLADLETALQSEGIEPEPRVVDKVRRLLADD